MNWCPLQTAHTNGCSESSLAGSILGESGGEPDPQQVETCQALNEKGQDILEGLGHNTRARQLLHLWTKG